MGVGWTRQFKEEALMFFFAVPLEILAPPLSAVIHFSFFSPFQTNPNHSELLPSHTILAGAIVARRMHRKVAAARNTA